MWETKKQRSHVEFGTGRSLTPCRNRALTSASASRTFAKSGLLISRRGVVLRIPEAKIKSPRATQEAPTESRYAEPMARLIEELKKLPGVGTKSAQRFAFHILRASEDDAAALADAVHNLKASLRLCSICNNITDVDPCTYCTSPSRNQRLICVVEEPTSIGAVERTRGYSGVYHVLHGTLSPLHGIGPDQLRVSTLLSRVERGEVDEVILATSPTLEGEATATWLGSALRGQPVRITRIATGVPAGSDIEYADEVTMARSLENRRDL